MLNNYFKSTITLPGTVCFKQGLVDQEFLLQGQELHHSLIKTTIKSWGVLLIHTNCSIKYKPEKSLHLHSSILHKFFF